jgi:hypothetical protein
MKYTHELRGKYCFTTRNGRETICKKHKLQADYNRKLQRHKGFVIVVVVLGLFSLGYLIGAFGHANKELSLRVNLDTHCNYKSVPEHPVDCSKAIRDASDAGFEVIYLPHVSKYILEER